VGRRWCRGQDL